MVRAYWSEGEWAYSLALPSKLLVLRCWINVIEIEEVRLVEAFVKAE